MQLELIRISLGLNTQLRINEELIQSYLELVRIN